MFIFMAHLLLFQPVISFWGWQYFGSGDKESLYINYLFFLCWGIWYFSTVWFLIEGKSACQCRRCGFDPWVRKILLYGRIMLPKWACHSPTPPPLTVFSAHQVCVSGVHSFFLVICLQLKSICRSALVFGKHVYNSLLSLSFSLWRPDWFPRWLSGKGPPATAGDAGSRPLLVRSPVEGNGHPLQYSCLKNSMDRSLVGYSLWGHKESTWLRMHAGMEAQLH